MRRGVLLASIAFALMTAVGSRKLPPVGAVYERTLTLPVIGEQTVTLAILDGRLASITLAGALSLEEQLEYVLDDQTGKLLFELSEATELLLRRLRVGLDNAEYFHVEDQASVTIAPPLFRPIRIRLYRRGSVTVPAEGWLAVA